MSPKRTFEELFRQLSSIRIKNRDGTYRTVTLDEFRIVVQPSTQQFSVLFRFEGHTVQGDFFDTIDDAIEAALQDVTDVYILSSSSSESTP